GAIIAQDVAPLDLIVRVRRSHAVVGEIKAGVCIAYEERAQAVGRERVLSPIGAGSQDGSQRRKGCALDRTTPRGPTLEQPAAHEVILDVQDAGGVRAIEERSDRGLPEE